MMVTALKQHVVVQPGGVIEIRSDELPEGARAEVIVLLESSSEPRVRLSQMIGAGRGSFATPAEAGKFLNRERDSWEY